MTVVQREASPAGARPVVGLTVIYISMRPVGKGDALHDTQREAQCPVHNIARRHSSTVVQREVSPAGAHPVVGLMVIYMYMCPVGSGGALHDRSERHGFPCKHNVRRSYSSTKSAYWTTEAVLTGQTPVRLCGLREQQAASGRYHQLDRVMQSHSLCPR
ncbi:hypothetical protein J6590_010011 [Homalodisca vitripennis]|nr:hypothetical protein J6590_010011 [Homalodisca vitripennis]